MRDRAGPTPLECDYDERPDRFRLAREVLRKYGAAGDIHPTVAARLVAEDLLPVLDVGCGDGELGRYLPPGGWVGVDASATMVAAAGVGARLGRAEALPFADASFASVTLLFVLYHLDSPEVAVAEARRVSRPGGLVAAAAASRHDSPELAFALKTAATSFDAEIAPDMMSRFFDEIEVDSWDAPLIKLPDRDAVRDYLIGKCVEPAAAAAAAQDVEVPLTVTKRGALVWCRVRSRGPRRASLGSRLASSRIT